MQLTCSCGTVYNARIADINRGWAKSCSKSCAALKRNKKPTKAVYRSTLSKPNTKLRAFKEKKKVPFDFDGEPIRKGGITLEEILFIADNQQGNIKLNQQVIKYEEEVT